MCILIKINDMNIYIYIYNIETLSCSMSCSGVIPSEIERGKREREGKREIKEILIICIEEKTI